MREKRQHSDFLRAQHRFGLCEDIVVIGYMKNAFVLKEPFQPVSEGMWAHKFNF